MEMREIILVAMCLAIGPLMVISDGGIETDYRLRAAVLEPISEKKAWISAATKSKFINIVVIIYLKTTLISPFGIGFLILSPFHPAGFNI